MFESLVKNMVYHSIIELTWVSWRIFDETRIYAGNPGNLIQGNFIDIDLTYTRMQIFG